VAGKVFGDLGYVICTFLFFGAVLIGLPAIAITGGYYAAKMVPLSPYIISCVILACGVVINLLSPKISGRINGGIASSLVFVLFVLIILGGMAAPNLLTPLNPPTNVFSLGGFSATFFMIFFAFTGWEIATNLSEEFHNPKKTIPLSMLFSFIIALVFYLALAWIIHVSGINGDYITAFSKILGDGYGNFAGSAISFCAVVMIFANLSSATWGVSRMVLSAARERLLPPYIASIKNGTPYNSVLLVTIFLMVVIAICANTSLHVENLLEYAGQNFILIYLIASLSLIFSSKRGVDILIGFVSVVVICSILYSRPVYSLFYPFIIIILSLFVVAWRRILKNRKVNSFS
jgi:amino acid efflux transporter